MHIFHYIVCAFYICILYVLHICICTYFMYVYTYAKGAPFQKFVPHVQWICNWSKCYMCKCVKWSDRNKLGVKWKAFEHWLQKSILFYCDTILRWYTAPKMESEISEIVKFWRILGLLKHPLSPICTHTLFSLL